MRKLEEQIHKPQARFLLQNTMPGFMVMKTLNVGFMTCKELQVGSSPHQGAMLDIRILRTFGKQEHSQQTSGQSGLRLRQ